MGFARERRSAETGVRGRLRRRRAGEMGDLPASRRPVDVIHRVFWAVWSVPGRAKVHSTSKLALQALDYALSDDALLPDIARRGDEDLERLLGSHSMKRIGAGVATKVKCRQQKPLMLREDKLLM